MPPGRLPLLIHSPQTMFQAFTGIIRPQSLSALKHAGLIPCAYHLFLKSSVYHSWCGEVLLGAGKNPFHLLSSFSIHPYCLLYPCTTLSFCPFDNNIGHPNLLSVLLVGTAIVILHFVG